MVIIFLLVILYADNQSIDTINIKILQENSD